MSRTTSEHWSVKARRARALEANWTGEEPKLLRDRAIAAEVGLSRQSLRNYLMAYDLVERVRESDPPLATLMLTKAPAALNEIERAEREVGAKALALVKDKPDASTAELIQAAQKLRPGKRRRVTEGRTLAALREAFATRQSWLDEHSDNSAKNAGSVLRAAMGALRLPALPLDRLTFSDPKEPFHKTAGVSGLAFLPPKVVEFARGAENPNAGLKLAPEHLWSMGIVWSHLVDLESPYAAVLELPSYSDLDHYKWAAKDSLYRAIAIATQIPLVIVLLPSPALRDVVSSHAPALPDNLVFSPAQSPGVEEATERQWPEHEKISNWRLVSKPGGAILYTCPQTAHIDLFGADRYAISRMKYGETVRGDQE